MKPKIIVHGGARRSGNNESERKTDVINACKTGYEALLEKDAVEAVEIAIRNLEASEYLNAGVGSYLQLDGRVRMDASIMKDDLSAGAVIGIEDVEHPISVARRVMETTQHVILSGPLATEFAHSEGFPRYDPRTKPKINLWMEIMEEFRQKTTYEQIFHVDKYLKEGSLNLGTVGCVAMDANGNIAAGTSTGGLKMNVPGRVGDSGIIGAGTYCSKFGGASCTGHGEKILILCLAKKVLNYLKHKGAGNAMDATKYGVEELNSLQAPGGIICIDKEGHIGYAHNTAMMTMHYIE
ncbi:MAG: isoaspartyl peptidase/L-asparaginase [Desulfobacterales bacterium]|uniref:Isoaspartyl peptidase n=1 Tax=Candidatus Desulfatibia vada TaxID=2841696 RepID=A0A8J6TKX7_9BACT|nr:isoaspartyl peptidase/L-asparaginase [Candidatus Desulfatibia vada]MBL6972631.1 isoaspartyl peptidase/L-asparaginase [Desulfobacterales bacterium]